MRIARWSHEDTIGEGFVVDDRVVAFPDGLTVATVLTEGLDAAHAAFARVTATPAPRSPTCGCSRRWCRHPSATSSPSRSTSRA